MYDSWHKAQHEYHVFAHEVDCSVNHYTFRANHCITVMDCLLSVAIVSALVQYARNMEVELSNRLQKLRLEEYPSVTQGSRHDCLFAALVNRIQEYAYSPSAKVKAFITDGEIDGNVRAKITVKDRETSHTISTVHSLRQYVGLAGLRNATTPHEKRSQVVQHMKHRFRNGISEKDRELNGGENLPDNATEVEIVALWCKIIMTGGTVPTFCFACVVQL